MSIALSPQSLKYPLIPFHKLLPGLFSSTKGPIIIEIPKNVEIKRKTAFIKSKPIKKAQKLKTVSAIPNFNSNLKIRTGFIFSQTLC